MTTKTQTELNLIQKAYIEPIRSVLIIDDQYPTWEDWLSGNVNGIGSNQGKRHSWANFKKIKMLIDKIRENNPARIVDIHNGDHNDANFRNYIHQSDLLILDYELEPETSKGEKFLKISHTLLEISDHFNLILTHTNSDDLSEPFARLFRSFLQLDGSFSRKLCDKGDEILGMCKYKEEIENSIWHNQYAAFRKYGDQAKEMACNNEAPFNDFSKYCCSQKLKKSDRIALLMSLLKRYETKFKDEFRSESAPKGFSYSTSEPFWIKTNRGFIAFAKKADSLDVVLELKKALVSWNPTPSRLLSARLRAEIESQGGIFEESFLSDNHVARMFYQKLLNENSHARATNICKEIQRQMEHYTDAVSDNLVEFGTKIVSFDTKENGRESQFSKAYNVSFSNETDRNRALDCFNSFVSCKPRTGNHLTPGHIFIVDNGSVWVVLSPACDLVPDRDRSGMHFKLDQSILPFTAARLFDENLERAREKATSTNYVFLRQDDGNTKAYNFYGSDDDDVKAPQSKTFFAKNSGRFDQNGNLQLVISLGISDDDTEKSEKVRIHNHQLRYEYALNLMAKLSAHSTRIGLEFEDSRFFD